MLNRQACVKFQSQIFNVSEVIQILSVVRWYFCQVYTVISKVGKNENFSRKFSIFAEAVLASTHNLFFGAKIRKIGIPLHTPVLLHKSGV